MAGSDSMISKSESKSGKKIDSNPSQNSSIRSLDLCLLHFVADFTEDGKRWDKFGEDEREERKGYEWKWK